MKLVVLDGGAANPGDLSWNRFASLGDLTVYDTTPPELAAQRMRGAHIVVNNKVPMDDALFAQCPDLRLVAVLATGYNVIDVQAAKARGIAVCNVPAYGTDAVAQHTFALLLELCCHIGIHDRSVHDGDWAAAQNYCYWICPLTELAGKTMGIIGFGNIGRRVAQLAQAFGMRVVYYSRTRCAALENETVRYAPLADVLANSDVVSLHCPLTPETDHILDARAIAGMKHGAILINTSRGPLLDEQAVADALRSGRLAGAGLDVLSEEPPHKDNPLLSAPHCIITPHIAWAPRETRARLVHMTYENVVAFLEGSPKNMVNS